MTHQLIDDWSPETLEDLQQAIADIEGAARDERHHPSTVYIKPVRISLVREILTDGSSAFNIAIKERE